MATEVAMVPCPGIGGLSAGEYPAMICPRCRQELDREDSESGWQVPHHLIRDDLFDCSKCGDTGKLSYRTLGDLEPRPIGNGYTIQDMGTSGTRACSCVRDLPPTDGDATWWESETVLYEVFTDTITPDTTVEVTVDTEVPRNEAGRKVHMRGNRYYPTMVNVEGSPGLIHGDALRDLAAMFQRAADKVDEIDGPCEDLCGHWWPCECVADVVGRAAAPYTGIPFLSREDRWKRDHPSLF
jgi:hypothetical protein